MENGRQIPADDDPTKPLFWWEVSEENLGELNDFNYFILQPPIPGSDPKPIDEWREKSEPWQRLTAVKEGRVITPSGDGQQVQRTNVPYAHMVIDDIYRGVFHKEASEMGNPNPFANWLAHQ